MAYGLRNQLVGPGIARYQTISNHFRHSKSSKERLTLVLLSVLRVLPMARTAFILILFAALSFVSASGAQKHKPHTHHAAAAKASHRSTHSRARHAGSHAAHAVPTVRHTHGHATYHRRKRTASIKHPKPAMVPAAPHPTQEDSAPPSAPAQSARLRGGEHGPPAAAAAPASAETPESAEPLARLRAASRAEDAPNPEPESDSATAASSAIENDAPPVPTAVSLRSTRILPVAPLHGSLASLVRQNEKTDADNLERIENDDDLRDRIARGMLVPVPTSSALAINQNLPPDRRYCRPWTARFLADLARAHETQFHRPLEVSSAVRTVDYQKRLMGVNGNAAPAEGDIVSPHVTGATIDIAKSGLTQREIYWMRGRLLALQNQGKLDVEEEFQQACFHITVYKSYVAPKSNRKARHRAVPTPVATDGSTVQPGEDTAGD